MWNRFKSWFRTKNDDGGAPAAGGTGSMLGLLGSWSTDHYQESLQFISWTFIACHTKSIMAGSAEWGLYRTLSGADDFSKSVAMDSPQSIREPLEDRHPLYDLLSRPNPIFTRRQFLYQCMLQMSLTGTAYIWDNTKEGRGELWVLPTGLVLYRAPTNNYPEGSYYVSASSASLVFGNNVPMELDARQVMRIYWPSPLNSWEGTSAVSAGAAPIDIGKAMEEAAWSAFTNEVRGGLLLSIDSGFKLTPEQMKQAEQQIGAMKAGRFKTGSTILMQGVTPHQTNRAPSELDYTTGRHQIRDDVFAYHQVSPVAAGVIGVSSYAEHVAAVRSTIEIGVQPMLTLIADAVERRFERFFGPGLEVELIAPSPSDPAEKRSNCDLLARYGAISINELRAEFGRGPVDGGDSLIVPGGATEGGDNGAGQPVPDNTGNPLSDLLGRATEGAR